MLYKLGSLFHYALIGFFIIGFVLCIGQAFFNKKK